MLEMYHQFETWCGIIIYPVCLDTEEVFFCYFCFDYIFVNVRLSVMIVNFNVRNEQFILTSLFEVYVGLGPVLVSCEIIQLDFVGLVAY